jgi:hypothetical protein
VLASAHALRLEYLRWAVLRELVTVVCRVVAYELIQRVCEIKQGKLCLFLCIETRVLIVVSSEILCEFGWKMMNIL